jgi:hypothetical protein
MRSERYRRNAAVGVLQQDKLGNGRPDADCGERQGSATCVGRSASLSSTITASLGNELINGTPAVEAGGGRIRRCPRLGGLLNYYRRAA